MLFVLTAYLSSSCQKEQISPINQEVAFVKYYGHVGDQTATDIIQTSDGGYVMLGSTNSYSGRTEMDILVVKTDALGNELWSSAFGRSEGVIDGTDFLRFSEEGIRILELPNASAYVLAANRTYIDYPSENSTLGVRGETKVVLYQLDPATGAPASTDGIELRIGTNKQFTEKVADMKVDTASGAYNYILTGYTTDVQPNKPNDIHNGQFDYTDIFTVLLDETFAVKWSTSSLAYGFPGADYGTSVQILPTGYLICGTSEERRAAVGQTGNYVPRLITVIMEKSGGTPINPSYFGEDDYYFKGGHSVYDATNQIITIAAYIDNDLGVNAEKGNIALLQLREDLTPITPNAPAPTYCRYYDLPDRNGNTGTEHLAASIALLPGNNGYALSATHKSSEFESDISITKFDTDLEIVEGWPYYFGYADKNGLVLTSDQAGTILPVLSGSSNQSSITGYIFAGKFGLGTNDVMGMVKLNTNGTFTPE